MKKRKSKPNVYSKPFQPSAPPPARNLRKKLMPFFKLSLLSLAIAVYTKNSDYFLQSLPTHSPQTRISAQQLYTSQPNLKDCYEGVLKEEEKTKVLKKLNQIRSLHGLQPVRYAPEWDVSTAKSALVVAANADQKLSQTPRCSSTLIEPERIRKTSYSVHHQIGDFTAGVGQSLYNSEQFVAAILGDSRRKELSGRRKLLDPSLEAISFGRVDDRSLTNKANILTFNGEKEIEIDSGYTSGATISTVSNENLLSINPDLIAYPFQDYPKELFEKDTYQKGYPLMSISIVFDRKNLQKNQQVNFARSSVQVLDEQQKPVKINAIFYDNSLHGVPNVLSWQTDSLRSNTKYRVKIGNVQIGGSNKNYEYWFRLK